MDTAWMKWAVRKAEQYIANLVAQLGNHQKRNGKAIVRAYSQVPSST
jgi:hypothetical protein